MTNDALKRIENKLDRLSDLIHSTTVDSVKHSSECDESRKNMIDQQEEIKKRLADTEKSLGKLWLRVIAVGSVVAAGGAGAIEVVRAIIGG